MYDLGMDGQEKAVGSPESLKGIEAYYLVNNSGDFGHYWNGTDAVYGRMVDDGNLNRVYSMENLPGVQIHTYGDEPAVTFTLPSGNRVAVTYEPTSSVDAPKGLSRVSIYDDKGNVLEEKGFPADGKDTYLHTEGLYFQPYFRGGLDSKDPLKGGVVVKMQVPGVNDVKVDPDLPQLPTKSGVLPSNERSKELVAIRPNSQTRIREVSSNEFMHASPPMSWREKLKRQKQPHVVGLLICPQYTSNHMLSEQGRQTAPISLLASVDDKDQHSSHSVHLILKKQGVANEPEQLAPPNVVESTIS